MAQKLNPQTELKDQIIQGKIEVDCLLLTDTPSNLNTWHTNGSETDWTAKWHSGESRAPDIIRKTEYIQARKYMGKHVAVKWILQFKYLAETIQENETGTKRKKLEAIEMEPASTTG